MTRAEARQGPIRFDAFRLAANGDHLQGTVDARQFARVEDRLADVPGPADVAWRIDGGRDGLGRASLTVTVDGPVPLVCQRCLQPFAWSVEQHTNLLLARNESELVALDAEEPEVVLASEALDALTLVEDELLLSLPYAPRHPEGECERAVGPDAAEPDKSSPFAKLNLVKSTLKSGND